MKTSLIIIMILGLITGFLNTTFAAPSSVTLDSRNEDNIGIMPSDGISIFFETGIYRFSILDGAWNNWGGGYNPGNNKGWMWSMFIYQESNGMEFELGSSNLFSTQATIGNELGSNNVFSTASEALSQNASFSFDITVSNPSGENIWFYIKDDSARDNVGTITSSIAVVPEPVSSSLFIIGGILFAGRRYLKRKIS